ncbi:unnamed protein product [Prorocentrum cordatum]|uniref:J domain-containing protein n=1 Tax=Prorocentrum cordatum TaxID=2364126 RepID=A0ABN9SHE1_9DINO|nr:unnamed protein product [Polarella glacialis]
MALVYHPDKPTGDHKAFICLQTAFELLQDASKRADYDQDLHDSGSQDGMSSIFSGEGPETSTAESLANPEALRETFLGVPQSSWEALARKLSAPNRRALLGFLNDHRERYVQPKQADRTEVSTTRQKGGGGPSLGIIRKGSGYAAKATYGSFIVATYREDLTGAIDARMALLQLKTRLVELGGMKFKSKALAAVVVEDKFDDAMRQGISELRAAEQASAFYLKFSFELAKQRHQRLTSSTTCDLEVALKDRRDLIGASPGADADRVHSRIKAEAKARQADLNDSARRRDGVSALIQLLQETA